MKRIMCYGDSNTWGHNPNAIDEKTGFYCRYPEHVRWTSVLQDSLGSEYIVCEEGLCGRTTSYEDPTHYGWNGNQYLEVAIRTCDPLDCIILMLGTNDTKDMFGSSAYVITLCLERLIRNCKDVLRNSISKDARIIVACPVMVQRADDGTYWYGFSEESTKKGEEMRKRFADLAQLLGCEFFDVNTVATVDGADGVHLNTQSHISLGKALAEKIREVL